MRNSFAGGCRVVRIYAEELARKGHVVTVVTTPGRPPHSHRKRLAALIRKHHLQGQTVLDQGHLDGLDETTTPARITLPRFRPVASEDVPDADVAIACFWETAPWVAAFSPSKGAKAYLVQHDEAISTSGAERADATYRLPMLQVCVSDWTARSIRKRHPESRQVVIPNGVDHHLFSPRATRPSLSTPTVGLMWSRRTWKGSDVAISAIMETLTQYPSMRIVGFTKERPRASEFPTEIWARLQLEETPPQERIADIYSSCHCWVFASRVEGFGLPLLEAMACGTPVAATAAGAAPDLVPAGGGELVPVDDAVGLGAAIKTIIGSTELEWRQRSEAATALARRCTWTSAADQLENALIAWSGSQS